jgi:hypothetical protein
MVILRGTSMNGRVAAPSGVASIASHAGFVPDDRTEITGSQKSICALAHIDRPMWGTSAREDDSLAANYVSWGGTSRASYK